MTPALVPAPAVAALLRDHPGRFDTDRAAAWVQARRALLVARCAGSPDAPLAVSSGCAASGAQTHGHGLADDARAALVRLEDGSLTRCAVCGDRLDADRLDGAPAATTCTGCARPDRFDARWCR